MLADLDMQLSISPKEAGGFAHLPLDQSMAMLLKLQEVLRDLRKPQIFIRDRQAILEQGMVLNFMRRATDNQGHPILGPAAFDESFDETLRKESQV